MTALTHMATGVFIATIVDNPVLGLPLAFISHFVLDAIPHNDYFYFFLGKDFKYAHQSPINRALMLITIILLVLFSLTTTSVIYTFSAGVMGILPDVITKLLKRNGYKQNLFNDFHEYIHSSTDLGHVFYNSTSEVCVPSIKGLSTEERRKNFNKLNNSIFAKIGWYLSLLSEGLVFLFCTYLIIY